MGLKIRMGMALTGLALSSMFGVNLLSGIKDYVDTTGNIMVDIADGIAMVSQGIEAIEHYLHPEEEKPSTAVTPEEATPITTPTTQEPIKPDVAPSSDQPAVFCQKGKCYPYDPAKANPNLNLEAKPGMILTAQTPTKTTQPPPKNEQNPTKYNQGQRKGQKKRRGDDDDEEELSKYESSKGSGKRDDRPTVTISSTVPVASISPESTAPVKSTLSTASMDSPSSSDISTSPDTNNKTDSADVTHGIKKILSSTKTLLERLSKVLVKLVHKIFPWNRRARRRVMGDGEDDEL